MNKLLNEALRAKGYKGAEIKMVLTDVTDPKGVYYTDTLTNTVVFDRNKLANANRDEILNALGHEFGHYSKADDIDKSQDIANYTGGLLEKRTKNLVSKEATEETLGEIRNNKNVIIGEEGKKLAESIPMDRREYYEAITAEGRIMFTFAGADGGVGVIYNKDPITGKEEFGIIENEAGKIGVSFPLVEAEILVNTFSESNAPIKEFEGYYGGVRGTVGYIAKGSLGMTIADANKVSFNKDIGIGEGIGFSAFLGRRHVKVLKNPPEFIKSAIRFLVDHKAEVESSHDIYSKIKEIKDYYK